MPSANRPTPGELTILAAGAVALVSSFFDFYTLGDAGATVWRTGLFPVAALMVVFVVIMAVQVLLTRVVGAEVSSRPFGFTWEQIHLVLGFFATLDAVAYLLLDRGATSLGIGYWGILIGCVAALVGAVLLQRERAGSSGRY